MVKVIKPEQHLVGFSTINKKTDFELHDYELAKRDLLNEFFTVKGERLCLPDFGSIVWTLIFEPLTEEIRDLIEDDVRTIVEKDPRFEIEDLEIEDFEHGFIVNLVLKYIPMQSIEQFTVTFDQRLREGG